MWVSETFLPCPPAFPPLVELEGCEEENVPPSSEPVSLMSTPWSCMEHSCPRSLCPPWQR